VGFVSNQWLNRGENVRNRRYSPKQVAVRCFRPTDDWSTRNSIHAEFEAMNEDGQMQTLHLTQGEVQAAATELLAAMSAAGRERLLVAALQELSHSKLLRVLAFDLRQRVRLPK
jgi:hypothetical protein